MIDVKELRIGNRIYGGKDGNTEFTVLACDFETIEKYPENYEGIQITEDRILAFGLIKNSDTRKMKMIFYDTEYYHSNGDILIIKTDNTFYGIKTIFPGESGDYQEDSIELTTIHQFQNLYFALHEREL